MQASSAVRFVPVTDADVERLAATAKAAYLPHYSSLWTDGGEGYVRRSFAPAVLAADRRLPGVDYRFIETATGTAGFLKCVFPAPGTAGATGSGAFMYLERLYLAPDYTGLGIGSAALGFVASQARERGLAGVWLRAMADERRVVAFYERHGYLACGSDRLASTSVVEGRERMLRMRLELGGE